MSDRPIKLGYVTSVSGSRVCGVLSQPEAGSADEARYNRAVQIGALLKLQTARSIAFGVVGSAVTAG